MMAAPRAVRVACAIYRLALALQPRDIRRRYGAEMRAVFAALAETTGPIGTARLAALCARETADVVRSGLRSRFRRPPTPSERRKAVTGVVQDVRYAWRTFVRQPSFAVVAIVTLALGIGANTAVFTVVNGVLLRPLSYAEPDRLVVLLTGHPGRLSAYFSPLDYLDVTREAAVFVDHAAYTPTTMNLTGAGEPQRLHGALVAWNFFRVLGAPLAQGRAFVEDDATGDRAAVVVSDGFWKRVLGGRSDIVGTTIRLDGKPMQVVGIAAQGINLPAGAEFWRPLVFEPSDVKPQARGAHWIEAVARLQPEATLQQANAALATVSARLAAAYPRTNEGRVAEAAPLHDRLVSNIRSALIVLLAAVLFVLLIACVNVANLLLARAQTRSREMAVRGALGASRRRLIRQLLSESALLGAIGAAGGLLVAMGATRALAALGPASIPRLADVTIDVRVLAFTIATAIVTSVLFGLAPALTSTGGLGSSGSSRGTVGSGGTRVRRALVVCEMALAVVLLFGAGLLIRSYTQLARVNPGFDPEHVLTFDIALPESKYTAQTVGAFVTRLLASIQAEPSVTSAAAVFGLPLQNDMRAYTSFLRPGEADVEDGPTAAMRVISPDYFRTMRIPLEAGRGFDTHDTADSPEVVIVNDAAVRRYWPDRNPLGQQVRLGVRLTDARSTWKTIVGVVGDVRYNGLNVDVGPEIYLPYPQQQLDAIGFVVRTPGDPMALATTMRRDVAALDPELPLDGVRPVVDLIGASVGERRFTMLLLATFAGLAVVLAAIGIYGVLAYLVSQRTQEIGVRLAMGATPRDVVALIVREGASMAALGVVLGLAAALAAARGLTSLLFGVTAGDPVTLVAVSVLLGAIAIAASYVPARRAGGLDPATALRTD